MQATADPAPAQSSSSGSEPKLHAEDLIRALKSFVLKIVGDSASAVNVKTVIEIALDREDQPSTEQADSDDEVHSEVGLIRRAAVSDRKLGYSSFACQVENAMEGPWYTIEEKLQGCLHDHVFNKMPIRLLCFEKHESNLRIELLERSSIFSRLESKLRAALHTNYPSWKLSAVPTKSNERAIGDLISKYARYAILSHTWLRSAPGEVTYGDWTTSCFNTDDPGYRKLVNFAQVAWADHGLTFGWMDTVCINKESSSELDESIRSMYTWYGHAAMCIVHLSETESLIDMHLDPWFTRGWTLQELLAPQYIKFYNRNWEKFAQDSSSDRDNNLVMGQICHATTITMAEFTNIHIIPFSRRMQLAAAREVTREEDTAYSLMGIFDVSMAIAYGEGAKRAFFRLLQEILNSHSEGIFDLFNWAGEKPASASEILPTTPQHYLRRSFAKLTLNSYMRPLEPLTLTHMGLCIPVLLMPAVSIDGLARNINPIGDYDAIAIISPEKMYRRIPTTYDLLDSRVSGPDGLKDAGHCQYTFAVFNIQRLGTSGAFFISPTCIAILLKCSEPPGKVTSTGDFAHFYTKEPIVFQMQKRDETSKDNMVLAHEGIHLLPDELEKHGMQLISKYL
ncbi:hypothetical protein BDN70DRAFT_877444 [Pholiota conissans]|uniref:Heterokaryon incompatibility domain-containing protein n=1 Tax=Pholiota conissans TaxID=109636 RepID=A0A9P5Z5U8_9AGAR|nr:hypothetical protein BDN70DRAFT_877444 [Pholiota conissans]